MKDSLWQQTSNGGEDIDSLRGEFESSREWRLRKKFLEMNYSSLPVNRLMCLSRCFVNIALYGCSYPATVMEDIRVRSGGILEEFNVVKNIEDKQIYTDSFVKASSVSVSRVGSLGVSTAGLKKLRLSAQTADKRASHRTSTQGGSRVIHAGHDAFKKAVTPATSTSMALDDYDYWDGQEDITDDISLEESMDNSTVPAVNTNPYLWSQGTRFFYPEPHSQDPKTALSKEECLIAYHKEASPVLRKIRKLAFEVLQLQSQLNQNPKQVIHSAGQRVPVVIAFDVEQVVNKRAVSYSCRMVIERIEVASEIGPTKKKAKTNVCEVALKVIMMPRLEIIQTGDKYALLKGTGSLQDRNMCQVLLAQYDTTKASSARSYKQELPGKTVLKETGSLQDRNTRCQILPAQYDITKTSSSRSSYKQELSDKTASYFKETNIKKVKSNQHGFKPLEDFIIIEKGNSSRKAVKILNQSAYFNKMLLEYDFYIDEMATRCVVKIEGEVVTDVLDSSKVKAKTTAAVECLRSLRSRCWVLKTKALDSSTSVSKEEIEAAELNSNQISSDNIGCRMLQKMGWSGGGVGKHGTGISEPITVVNVLNRQGLGLSAACGITDGFRQRMKEVIENYAASGSPEDLVFSSKFSNEEGKIIRDECQKLNLQCVRRGKKEKRNLCVSRKLSANELFEHIMACGGETAKYKLLPPGTEATENEEILPPQDETTKSSFSRSSKKKQLKSKGIRHCKRTLNKHLKREQRGDKTIEDFIIVLPCHPSAAGVFNILKQNVILNRMILESDFFIEKETTQCILKIEGEVVADVVDSSKGAAKRKAAAECLRSLRTRCWVLQTKQAVDSTTSVSKEEIQKWSQLKSNQISSDTIVGKNSTEISELVSMGSDINRLAAACGNSDDFKQLLEEFIENYATSGSAEDLAFSSEFSNEERKLILEKCQQLKLQSVSRGKGPNKYLCLSKILSASQLVEHVKACGGETAKYKLLSPGTEAAENEDILSAQNDTTKAFFARSSEKKNLKGKGIRHCKQRNKKLVKKEQRGDKTIEDFVIVLPWHPSALEVVNIVKHSAVLNRMLLKYDFFIEKETIQCILKIEGKVVAEVVDSSKKAAKRKAAAECLRSLRTRCWVLQTKQAVNSTISVSREEIQKWIQLKSNQNSSDTIVGKNGTEISEPVSMEIDINRLTAACRNSDFKQLLEEFIENYAASGSAEDLMFSSEFSKKERKLILKKCRQLKLRSDRREGPDRYLCVSKKLSASQLVEHVKACGGETAKYKLLPPGTEAAESGDMILAQYDTTQTSSSRTSYKQELSDKTVLKGTGSLQGTNTCRQILPAQYDTTQTSSSRSSYKQELSDKTVLKGTGSLQGTNTCRQILPAQYDTTQTSSSRSSYKQELSDKTVLKGTGSLQGTNTCRQILPAQYDTTKSSSSESSYKQELSDKTVSYFKETNIKKVKSNQHGFKPLEDFIIIEKGNSSRKAVKILNQSAYFNKMLLEYDFYIDEMATRCVVKIEGEVVTDVLDSSKVKAKTTAAVECLRSLRSRCWVLKTKALDSSTSVSKEEIEAAELNSNQISSDNIGCRMLQKMGWSGGGVGKHGTGISEPITVVNVLNRQGLGLSAARGISDGFRQRMKEVIENYATSGSPEDLVFSSKFSNEEGKIIRDECQKLNLQCVRRGKKEKRNLCVSRKLSANELFEHIMACGGETAKYKLLPPGTETTENEEILPPQDETTKSFSRSSKKKKLKGKGIRHCKRTLNKHLKREQRGDKTIEDFIIVLPCHPSAAGVFNILKQNVILNRMILESDFFIEKETTQCILKIEGEVVADVVDSSKGAAKRKAAAECLRSLRTRCWVLQTKQAVDSTTSVSKEVIQKWSQLKSNQISSDTIVGKNSTEISEPVSMGSDINRLAAACGNSDDFKQLLEEFIENYATSGSADDLTFSSEFSNEERKLILEKCQQLKLQSVSRGKGPNKYLCLSKILSASQLVEHVKACGGETAKYKLLSPGTEAAENEDILSAQNDTTKAFFARSSEKKNLKGKGIRHCKQRNKKLVKKEQRGDKRIEDFVIVLPWHPSALEVVNIVKHSAVLNRMLLKYDFFIEKETIQCILKIEGKVVAEVVDSSKKAAKRKAAAECLRSLRTRCWVLQTKQAVNSTISVSREEIQKWIQLKSNQNSSDTIVGKNGTEISEPVSMEIDINRLTAACRNSDDFKQLLEEFIENYAASGSAEDLMFSSEFSKKERKLILKKCRQLKLRSDRREGPDRYLCVSKKLSASQLVEHVKACGGETAKYKLLPLGTDVTDEDDQLVQGGDVAE